MIDRRGLILDLISISSALRRTASFSKCVVSMNAWTFTRRSTCVDLRDEREKRRSTRRNGDDDPTWASRNNGDNFFFFLFSFLSFSFFSFVFDFHRLEGDGNEKRRENPRDTITRAEDIARSRPRYLYEDNCNVIHSKQIAS